MIGGILATVGLGIVPLAGWSVDIACLMIVAVYGLQRAIGKRPGTSYRSFHQIIDPSWIRMRGPSQRLAYLSLAAMEVATIVAGAFLLYHIPFPFLMAPICFALMYLTMDTAPAVYLGRRFTMVEFAYVLASELLRGVMFIGCTGTIKSSGAPSCWLPPGFLTCNGLYIEASAYPCGLIRCRS
jgi:hypothetical protein